MLTLKQMRYFVEISREGSFTSAAHTLSVAQPALSYQIGQLEAHLGTPLFVRTPKGVTLTDAGEILLAHVQPILRGLGDAVAAARDRGAMVTGTVCVAFLSSVAPFLAPLLVSECRRRFPQVVVSVAEGDNRAILERLRNGTLDFAVTLSRSTPGQELPLVSETLFLYSRRGGPASGRQAISLAEALEHRLVLPPRTHMLRELIEDVAGAHGLKVKVDVEAGHATSKSLVMSDIGCGIANFAAFKSEFEAGIFDAAALVDPPIRRTLVLGTPRNERNDRAAAEVKGILLNSVNRLGQALRWQRPEKAAA
jgi:LysR family nitrogen assimilation transcriptional regulator